MSCTLAAKKLLEPVNVILELGGEDAKIVYFSRENGKTKVTLVTTNTENAKAKLASKKDKKGKAKEVETENCECNGNCSGNCHNQAQNGEDTTTVEARMNTMCAAGTGAFID